MDVAGILGMAGDGLAAAKKVRRTTPRRLISHNIFIQWFLGSQLFLDHWGGADFLKLVDKCAH